MSSYMLTSGAVRVGLEDSRTRDEDNRLIRVHVQTKRRGQGFLCGSRPRSTAADMRFKVNSRQTATLLARPGAVQRIAYPALLGQAAAAICKRHSLSLRPTGYEMYGHRPDKTTCLTAAQHRGPPR